ncbi:TPA: LOW QUALITY PROTEIN: hypothetical protein N0F65_005073 [Lagenidium giganteum]|uniref:Reverse transcriptase/retrotransposon-derived protein RNase H-like domain-containing protein n=1 Tax=Lagenidium giganteum TaxID=4803 RepID=A0AAV2ZLU7_9STRA|nr:TPA: LOW QUALITY PROTEIN: hypothetical protein N0F65_005073 [Lagenidium giganteum]
MDLRTLEHKKCVFVSDRLVFLGYELFRDGAVNAVREFPVPKDVVELKRFVPLANFGTGAAPMTKLLPVEQDAFDDIRLALVLKPMLTFPDFKLPFALATDASIVGWGGVLMQDFCDGQRPVAYASKATNDAQFNYAITHLEYLAAAVKLFHSYRYGRVTDQAALRWLMTRNASSMGTPLHEYDLDIEYRPGKENEVVQRAVESNQLTGVILRHQATIGLCCSSVRANCHQGQRIWRESDGVVKIETMEGIKTVLPASLWALAFEEAHGSVWSGHRKAFCFRDWYTCDV